MLTGAHYFILFHGYFGGGVQMKFIYLDNKL
jgi:hypothetical protein